ncbi:MAG: hypothetical protein HGA62_08190 [Chlorobiaceae bacterium]|nr:hypothetical protein [Chlorobiaceae bacterium]NTV60416.1 hypothetical protein [Chlorobiaceae bacterium]
MTRLKFVVQTGDCSQACSCSDIWCRIIDWSGLKSPELKIRGSAEGAFQPGSSFAVILDVPGTYGPISEIEVRKDDVPEAYHWLLEKIKTSNLDTEDECTFNFSEGASAGEWFSPDNGLVHRRRVPVAEVFWCARDLSVYPDQNHHFLAIAFRSRNAASRLYPMHLTEESMSDIRYFLTLGGYAEGAGKMMCSRFNQEDDADTFRTYLNSGKYFGSWYDMDYEKHVIEPLEGKNEMELAGDIIRAGMNFMMHEDRPRADCSRRNCATFVNTLLASLGYPENYRVRKGAFWVDDCCEETLMDTSFFLLP